MPLRLSVRFLYARARPTVMSDPPFDPSARIATELGLPLPGVRAVAALLEEKSSVPFIARYRKERTGGLDEVAIRRIEDAYATHRALGERRSTVLAEIDKQGKLTPELRARVLACTSKSELEDLYLPFKPKRRTRAMMAKERGLEPLALRILAQPPKGDALAEARAFVDPAREVPDVEAALTGARDIVAEIVAERTDARALARRAFDDEGAVVSSRVPSKTKVPTKFETYYDYRERAKAIPSHRLLAILRGESEGVLRAKVEIDEGKLGARLLPIAGFRRESPFAGELAEAVSDAVHRLLCPSLESEVRANLKLSADRDAIQVFAENLRRLLLAAPLGRRVVLGIDPGQRTGCKCVVVDDTGKLVVHTLVNLVQGASATEHARKTLKDLFTRHAPFAVAVGNGTHGRETADFCRDLIAAEGLPKVPVVLVNESGASIYSASDVAREEFPDLDLTVRGAVSIARRLQDPLGELVKIDPKSIGVGQYQHDVSQPLLQKKLDEVVESCVNAVGVELNMASAPLLSFVAGVGPSLARKIVKEREAKGAFRTRTDLMKRVPGFGPRTFEQCAGFVRIRGGAHPLDESAVHPERYDLVLRIAKDSGVPLASLVGNAERAEKVPWTKYVSATVGLPTLEDIQKELAKPGRDPRDSFEAPAFRDDVRTMQDLAPGMQLEGVVTNVTAFGAFVDVGVHQDGLVHVSQLADRFVKDPGTVVKVGDRLKVRVLSVDLERRRISLTLRAPAG